MTMTDLIALAGADYWTLRKPFADRDNPWYGVSPRSCPGLGIGIQACMLPVPSVIVTDNGRYSSPMLRYANVVSYHGTHVTADGAHYSRWGHGEVCLGCGAESLHPVASSVSCEDAPYHFQRKHRGC